MFGEARESILLGNSLGLRFHLGVRFLRIDPLV
jgi:hypothetical protein